MLDIKDLPLDVWDGKDADNSILQNGVKDPVGEEFQRLQQIDHTIEINKAITGGAEVERRLASALYVPYKREIKFGKIGNDCFAVKRALSRAGFGTWGEWGKVRNLFGNYAVLHLKAFQKKNGIKVDGVYGLLSHSKLTPFFDSYGAFLMRSYVLPIRPTSKRDQVVSTAFFGYHNGAAIHYTESSLRMYGVRNHLKPPAIPRYEDCSSFATWCYYVAGASDPNGLGYDGQGYTGTLINHGSRVSISAAKSGDLVFYGRNAVPSHVAIYVGAGRVISNGGEIGPLLLSWNYRSDIHSIRSYL